MSPNLVERQVRRVRNGVAYLAGSAYPAVAQTPRDLVFTRDKARLWRYRSDRQTVRPPLLIVQHSGRRGPPSSTCAPGRRHDRLLPRGLTFFLLDSVPADAANTQNTLKTYVDG